MRDALEGVFRIEVEPGLWSFDRVGAAQLAFDQQLPALFAKQLEDPIDGHPITVAFIRALAFVSQSLLARRLDREQRLGVIAEAVPESCVDIL